MLQIHPDSTCDVCLDHYSFTNTAKTPHAIPCGHIFCYECLAQLNHPPSCPLCRKTFRAVDHIKKLHVDRPVPGERETAMPNAWRFVERLSRSVRGDVDIPTTEELIGEAQRWLETGNHKELFPEVDATFSALIKYKTLQERYRDQQATISRLHREEEQGRKDSLVEHGLIRKIQDLETQLEFYRHHFPGVRELVHSRGNSSASEPRANGGRDPNPNGPNPLPLPPKPIWHSFTAHNPNFVPPGNAQDPYQRTNIPPMPSQPYVYQTGAGAVFYKGASYDDRVVPPSAHDMAYRDVGYEDGRDRSRSRHRDRSRSRRRDGESEKDGYRRKRDRHRRDTMGRGDEDAADRAVVPGDQSPHMNALGIQQFHPGQGLYAPVAPPVTSASGTARYPEPYPSTSRAAGARSPYPAPGHPNAPPMAITVSVSGSRHGDALQNYGAGTSRTPNHIYRPSSTPTGPVLSTWTAPDLSNPSLNSLGLSAPRQGVNGSINSQAQPTARDSVSSWGTADSLAGPTHSDLFSSLRPLASAPADSGLPASDLLPREDGHLLGIGRSTQIASPRPQFPQAPMQPVFVPSHPDRDTDSRSRSRRSHHSRSQSQTSLVSNRDPSQHSASQSFTPEDRGFPYAPPHPRSVPIPYVPPRTTTPGSLPQSHSVSSIHPPFPQIPAPQPTTAVSRPPQNTHQPFFYGPSTSQSQNPSHRTHH